MFMLAHDATGQPDPIKYAQLQEIPRYVLDEFLELLDVEAQHRTLMEKLEKARKKRRNNENSV